MPAVSSISGATDPRGLLAARIARGLRSISIDCTRTPDGTGTSVNGYVRMGRARKLFHRKWRGQRITGLMARDGMDCRICELPLDRSIRDVRHDSYITFDHVVPRSLG